MPAAGEVLALVIVNVAFFVYYFLCFLLVFIVVFVILMMRCASSERSRWNRSWSGPSVIAWPATGWRDALRPP